MELPRRDTPQWRGPDAPMRKAAATLVNVLNPELLIVDESDPPL